HQWLDKSSARALEYVRRRLDDSPVGILTTTRPVGTHAAADTEVLRLGALTAAALHRLIDARLDVSLPRTTLLRVHRATEGNPFFALELTRALVAVGMPGAADPWPVPDDVQEIVAARVSRLRKPVRA